MLNVKIRNLIGLKNILEDMDILCVSYVLINVIEKDIGYVLLKFDKSMLGFEISINDDKPMTVATDSQAFVILSYGTSDCDMLVAGADDAFSYIWFDKIMQNGDKILIRIIDVGKDEVSSPFKIEKRNRERMKQTFEELKQELLNKQLL